MSKGDRITIPIYAMNTDKDMWGSDALEFKCAFRLIPLLLKQMLTHWRNNRPERWESPPEAISENPGVWGNLMTFLGGSRACIGYQFTLIEFVSPVNPHIYILNHSYLRRMKCLLFALIRKFEFGLVIPAEDIVWRNEAVVRRPFIKGEEQGGQKLPLYVKVHVPES